MPLNELEEHPYLNYFLEHHSENDVPWQNYTKMVIGSFPVHSITSTIYPVDNVIHRWEADNISMPFFYGSETNSFWRRLAETFGEEDPQSQHSGLARKEAAKGLLERNGIILTDVVKKTNRHKRGMGMDNPLSPADGALFNSKGNNEVKARFELNNSIVNWLILGENIRSIYFTAQKSKTKKTPGGWFHQILINNQIQYELLSEGPNTLVYRLSNLDGTLNRLVTLFFLPTPSSHRSIPLKAGGRCHFMFKNYLRSRYRNFYQVLERQEFVRNTRQENQVMQYREEFIKTWWSKFLVNEDIGFDGTVNEGLD